MGWLENTVQNAGNAVSQMGTGVGQVLQGGGAGQWGQNVRDGGTNLGSGFGNLYTSYIAGAAPGPGGYFYTGGKNLAGNGGAFGNQLDLMGNPIKGQDSGDGGRGGSGGIDPLTGMPSIPDYHPVYDPSTMSMLPGYMDQQRAESTGLNAMRSVATSPGESPWARAAKGENDANLNAELDRDAQSVAGQRASNNSALAMQGGLSEGARERNNDSATKAGVSMSQTANQTHDLGAIGIDKNDENNKLSMLGNVAGAEQAQVQGYANAKSTDTANQIGENKSLNDYNMGKYQTQAGIVAAGKTADAQSQAGKHGMFG